MPTTQAFAANALAKFYAAIRPDGCITTVAARVALGYTPQRWQKLTRMEGYPRPRRSRGNQFPIGAADLMSFLALRLYVENGMTVTEWARRTNHTRKYILAQVARRRAPQAIGYVRGHPRYDRAHALTWGSNDAAGIVHTYPARHGPPELDPGTRAVLAPILKKIKLARRET